MCPIYSEKARFAWLNSKMTEVHRMMKHAFKTINQCGVTALYRFQLCNVCSAYESIFLHEVDIFVTECMCTVSIKSRDCDVCWPP